MAFSTDGVGFDYFRMADDAALTFPDGDWTIAGWVRSQSYPVSANYVVSWNGYDGTPSFNMWRATGGQFSIRLKDDDGTVFGDYQIAGPGTSVVWRHIVLRRSSGSAQSWIDGSTFWGPTTMTSFNAINHSGQFTFGSRSDLSGFNSDNDFSEWAKWDRALSAAEIDALAGGTFGGNQDPWSAMHFPRGRTWLMPCIREYQEFDSGIAVTESGTAVTDSLPLIYPYSPYVIPGVAAAPPVGARPQGPLGHPLYGALAGPIGS